MDVDEEPKGATDIEITLTANQGGMTTTVQTLVALRNAVAGSL